MLAKKFQVPVFMTNSAHQAWARGHRDNLGELPQLARLEIFSGRKRFQVGDIEIARCTIPHDAVDPVGMTFRADGIEVGMLPTWDTCRPTFATSCAGAMCW